MVQTNTNLTTRRHVGRRGVVPNIIAIHTVEGPENPRTADNVANWFKSVDASSHWVHDNDSRVRVVRDEDTSWTLPGAANRSLNIELAGYARQSKADWADAFSIAMLEGAALSAAEWCIKYDIPTRKLTDDQIRNGSKGFVGHVDVNRVYRKSTHWDPGPHFPWPYFLGRVDAKIAELKSGKPATKPPTPSNDNSGFSQSWIKTQQEALNKLGADLDTDGLLGPKTRAAVIAYQKSMGLTQDGLPGPDTSKSLEKSVANQKPTTPSKPAPSKPSNKPSIKSLQAAVHADQDDLWGPDTEKRFNAVREASLWGGHDFPYGVAFTQNAVGTKEDGSWGKNSVSAHDKTVARIQKALLLLGHNPGKIDGRWGDSTEKAYQAARKVHKL